jgi:DNA-binding NarL/FixJ family response regulator
MTDLPTALRGEQTADEQIRVAIVDDQQLVRAGFRLILSEQEGIEVVGEAVDGVEAVSLAASLEPDVVLMDIRMPRIDGIEATRQIVAANGHRTKVLMLTTFDLDEYVYDALRAGASGFLLKDVPPDQLSAGVRMVSNGDALLAPSITRRLIEEFTTAKGAEARRSDRLAVLSPRETEVFALIARGLSNKEIAEQLFVGETTVKTHVARILSKLGVRDRVQAVVLAYEVGVATAGT